MVLVSLTTENGDSLCVKFDPFGSITCVIVSGCFFMERRHSEQETIMSRTIAVFFVVVDRGQSLWYIPYEQGTGAIHIPTNTTILKVSMC